MTALAPLTATIIWRHDWPAHFLLVELLEYCLPAVLLRVICAILQELV